MIFAKILSFLSSILNAVRFYGSWKREKEMQQKREAVDSLITTDKADLHKVELEMAAVKAKAEAEKLAELTPKQIEDYWNNKK